MLVSEDSKYISLHSNDMPQNIGICGKQFTTHIPNTV